MAVTINGSGQLAVQIQSVNKTDTFTTGTTNAWTDIDGMSVTITPTSEFFSEEECILYESSIVLGYLYAQ
jgi:hypothetical protein